MSRPTMSPPSNNLSKQILIGYAYLESFNPRGTRVYVPGYTEDFLVPNIPSFNSTKVLDQWIKFGIFTETNKLDPEGPLMMVSAPTPSKKGTIVALCEKVEDVVRIVPDGHIVTDPGNELGSRGLGGAFEKKELRLQLKSGLPNKPVFVVDKDQPSLPERMIPREQPVQAQNPPYQGFPRKKAFGRTPNQNSSNNNSDLPRHLRPATSRNSRPNAVFHPANVTSNGHHHNPPPAPQQHYPHHTPSPPSQNLRPRGYDDSFSSGRSSASSADYNSPPRNYAPLSPPRNYSPASPPQNYAPSSHSTSSQRTLTGENQRTQADVENQEIADILRTALQDSHFRGVLIHHFPELISRLLTLV